MVTVNESILLMNGAFDEDGTCNYWSWLGGNFFIVLPGSLKYFVAKVSFIFCTVV
jgi:arginine/ornithine N-succinyltransferase beta subunit